MNIKEELKTTLKKITKTITSIQAFNIKIWGITGELLLHIQGEKLTKELFDSLDLEFPEEYRNQFVEGIILFKDNSYLIRIQDTMGYEYWEYRPKVDKKYVLKYF